MVSAVDIPEGMKPPTKEALESLQKETEKVTLGLVDYFRNNHISKEVAAISMTMLLDHMAEDGVAVVRMNKTPSPEGT